MLNHTPSLALFCRVVDNFGDIGVCWRLARQLQQEYALLVQLWVDDLSSFAKICPAVQVSAQRQVVDGVSILAWDARVDALVAELGVADIVVEGFGCALPDSYLEQMLRRKQATRAAVWINLEYLSAEAWVEDCHGKPSPHPASGMLKYFFFPGFSARTGGLLAERDLQQRRSNFLADPHAQSAFWAGLGVESRAEELKISLFCYPHAPILPLLSEWQNGDQPVLCLVPQGVAQEALAQFFGQTLELGKIAQRGQLRVQTLPFVAQAEYDKLLWACDLNFVRGEDSFVRAQWAARPFVWQIYPQQEGVHLEKLAAFLQHYQAGEACANFWQAWNQPSSTGLQLENWRAFLADLPQIACYAQDWAQKLAKNGDLAACLMQFIRKIG